MSFLNAALLSSLLPLVALPLAIHLLNRRFPKLFRFPSVELIKETMARRSRLQRWRHLILWSLRTLLLLLLVLAFLKPVYERFGAGAPGRGDRRVLVVFDHSLSMGYSGDGLSPHRRAVLEAGKLIDSLAPGDWVNVLLLEQRPSLCFVEFSRNHAEAKQFVEKLAPGLLRGDVNQANALAARALTKVQAGGEVYFISDFQRKNWANADFKSLPPNARLFFVDVAASRRNNRAILDVQIGQDQVLAGDTLGLEIAVGNYAERPFEGRVAVNLDRRIGFESELSVAPWSVGKVVIPVAVGGPGLHQCEVSLPPDGLAADDRYRLTLPVLEKEEVLIVSDEPEGKDGAVFFLKTALNPYERLAGSLLPRVVASKALTSASLVGVHKLFLTKVGPLGPDQCGLLAKYLLRGGGAIWFLDGEQEPRNLAGLEAAAGQKLLPLRLTRRQTATNVTAGAQQIVKGDFKSRFLRLFRGSARQDLGLLEFYDYYQASVTGVGSVILSYGDESPAMASAGYGMGTLLLLNFSASELSGNLPRQRLFPAWIQELVKCVGSEESTPTAYTVGEELHAEVWRQELLDREFLGPAGKAVSVQRRLEGDRCLVDWPPDALGFYTLGGDRPLYSFAVNPSSDEADLRPVEKEVLPSALAENRAAQFLSGRDDYDTVASGRPLYHWFVLGGFAVLLLETGFQLLLRRRAA